MKNRKTVPLGVSLLALTAAPGVRPAPYPIAKPRPQLRRVGPTAALFTYRRNDTLPDNVTRVSVDAAQTASVAINQHVFGNFLEHLGGVVYEGVWADMLQNPNLEQIETRDTQPPAWRLVAGPEWTNEGYLSPRSIRFPVPRVINGQIEPETLEQTVHLPTHRTRKYVGSLYLRSRNGSGSLKLSIQGTEARRHETLAETVVRAPDTQWHKATFTLTLPSGSLQPKEAARFVVNNSGNEAIDVDQIEMYPVDAVNGLDPDVIRRARQWHIPLLRFPGGNFVSGYHWQDGIGPREKRPTKRNPAWGGIESNHFGTDEALRFCRLIGAEPQICVNAGNGTPEDAAAWVQYCNANAKTNKWAKLRAANGHPAPYGVRIWEIGNELYGDWQIGHKTAQTNATTFVAFRDAMLKADPTLRILATGKGEEFRSEGMERNRVWNASVLRAALANNGQQPDYLALHPLVPLPGDLGRFSYAEQYQSAMAHPAFLDKTYFPDIARTIAEVEGPNPRTKLACTEWGIIIGGDRWWESPNHDALSGAIYNALALNTMLRHSDIVQLANMTALMHGGGIKKPYGIVEVDPQYYTQQLYATAVPRLPLATTSEGPGQDVPARGSLPAVPNVPDVDVFAARTGLSNSKPRGAKTGRTAKSEPNAGPIVVFAVNRHLTEPRSIDLNIANFGANSVSAMRLYAADVQQHNTIETPNAVAPRPVPLPAGVARSGANHLRVDLPPHSLTVFTFTPRR